MNRGTLFRKVNLHKLDKLHRVKSLRGGSGPETSPSDSGVDPNDAKAIEAAENKAEDEEKKTAGYTKESRRGG